MVDARGPQLYHGLRKGRAVSERAVSPAYFGEIDIFYERTSAHPSKLHGALPELWQGSVPAVGSHDLSASSSAR